MDASYKIQRGIHVHLIQFFMCPEFWVHIKLDLNSHPFFLKIEFAVCFHIRRYAWLPLPAFFQKQII